MKRKWIASFLLSLGAGAMLVGCTQTEEETDASETELSVVASCYPMYECTKQVAGDRADISLMTAAGEDAHHYEPSAQDVAGVNEADVFVYSSEDMEHWVTSLLSTIENDDLVIARTADGVEVGESHEHQEAEHDHNHEAEEQENDELKKSITVHGVEDHYHTGDTVELIAELDEDKQFDHWHWYSRESAEDDWVTVPDQYGSEFEYEASGGSFEVRAVIFDDSHNEYAQSEVVEIVMDDHGQDHSHDDESEGHAYSNEEDDEHSHGKDSEHEHEEEGQHEHESEDAAGTVEIVGLAGHYHTGDMVTLVAELEIEADYDQWHWYMRGGEEEEWEVVEDQGTDHFEYKTTGESFEVKAVLLDEDQDTYAESDPVTVLIDDHEEQDPHIWLDPVLAQEQVNVIRDALIEADPEGQEIYEENAKAFSEDLQALHEEYLAALESAENRAFVVQHQAFGYLAQRYNLEQIAIGGISTEVEPSPSRIAEIGKLVEEYQVPVIYYQQGANSAIAETVASETDTETAVLYDLEVLSEELQAEDLGYLEAMEQNLESLQLSVQ